MPQPSVSILIPHYQTPQLTRLCLRLLRRHSRRTDYEVVVIDNGSQDQSAEALAEFRWIRVLHRKPLPNERPARSHGQALDMGMQATAAPLVLVMHTDTMVLRDDWLEFLMGTMEEAGRRCGSVGSWKMESTGLLRRLGKWFEDLPKKLSEPAVASNRYPRSHCALYRRAAIVDSGSAFDPGPTGAAAEALAAAMTERGWTTRLLSPAVLGRYVRHLNHATMALNEHFGSADRHMPRTRARSIRRINDFFAAVDAEEILADASLRM